MSLADLYLIAQHDYLIDLSVDASRALFAQPAFFKAAIAKADAEKLLKQLRERKNLDERRDTWRAIVGNPEWSARTDGSVLADKRAHLFRACEDFANSTAVDASKVLEDQIDHECDVLNAHLDSIPSDLAALVLEDYTKLITTALEVLKIVHSNAFGVGDTVPTPADLATMKAVHARFLTELSKALKSRQDVLVSDERLMSIARSAYAGGVALQKIRAKNRGKDLAQFVRAWSREVGKVGGIA